MAKRTFPAGSVAIIVGAVVLMAVAGVFDAMFQSSSPPPKADLRPAGPPAPAGPTSYVAEEQHGVVRGRFLYPGQRPEQRVLPIGGKSLCVAYWKERTPVDEAHVVNLDGTVPNVTVYAWKGPHKQFAYDDVPRPPVALDMRNCYFVPHVITLMVGQALIVTNRDSENHCITIKPRKNHKVNHTLMVGQDETFSFRRPEGKISIVCDCFSWMSAWMTLLRHPFHAVSDAQGHFEIAGLPAGQYTFRAWHEKFGGAEFQVTVPTDGTEIDVPLHRR